MTSRRRESALILRDSGIEEIHRRERERLIDICKGTVGECFSRNVHPVRLRVGLLHARPDSSRLAVANVHARLEVRQAEFDGLGFGLDVELIAKPGQFIPWVADVGDWGYGLHISGVRVRGRWIQLIGSPLPPSAWLPMDSQTLPATVTPLTGQILRLPPLRARWPDGAMRAISEGPYLFYRAAEDRIEFRAEIPSDFPCGEDLTPPSVMPPRLRTTPKELFGPDGAPRFEGVYTKGC
jgi:hypothetical protein